MVFHENREKRTRFRKTGRLVLFLLIAVCCIQAAGAKVNVYHVAITPNGEIIGNQTPVEVLALMDITSEDQFTFSPDNTLRFWTELEDPVYTAVISRDGNLAALPVRHSKAMTLTSWDLSYPSGSSLSLKVTVRGIAPNVTSTQERTLVRIAEATPNSIINGTEVIRKSRITYVPGARPTDQPFLARGGIAVTTDPEPAKIYLDGHFMCNSPANLTGIGTGTHSLTLAYPGYYNTTMDVTVLQDKTVEIRTSLNPAPEGKSPSSAICYVTLVSEPEKAQVFLDGADIGRSPFYNHAVAPGIHNVRMTLPGYLPYEANVQAIPGQVNSVFVRLVPSIPVVPTAAAGTQRPAEDGCIRCVSDPPGADIYIDHTFSGTAPSSFCNITPGTHSVLLILPFFAEYSREFFLEQGETVTVATSFSLSDLYIPKFDLLMGLLSGIQSRLPVSPPGTGELEKTKDIDRQKAYEDLVQSIGDEA